MSKVFERTGLYHSDLVRESAIAPMVVMFTGEPRDSKYKDKPRWVGMMVHGDETKYVLNIESPDIEAAIVSVPRDQWLHLQAAGDGRSGTAYMILEDDAGPILPDTPSQPVAGPQAPPAAIQQPVPQAVAMERLDRGTVERAPLPHPPSPHDAIDRLTDEYYLCLVAAKAATDKYHAEFGVNPDEDTRRTAITLFIQSHPR